MNSHDASEVCKRCTAWCCTHTGKMLTRDEETFMRFQGHEIQYKSDGSPYIFLNNACQYLDENNLCSIYNKKRHWVCKAFPNKWNEVFAPHCELMRETCPEIENKNNTVEGTKKI